MQKFDNLFHYVDCSIKPCKNGGECIGNKETGFKCKCPKSHRGRFCQKKQKGREKHINTIFNTKHSLLMMFS